MTPQFSVAVRSYGPRFVADLGLQLHHVAGIFGNFAVESNQFRALQEYKPTVKGSRGGWGWAQWTGPRRRQFEAWADAQGMRRDDPDAFYAYTLVELRGVEKAALAALRRTKTVEAAAETFMLRYERPGIPHLERRKAFAREALAMLSPNAVPTPQPAPAAKPAARAPASTARPAAPVAASPTAIAKPGRVGGLVARVLGRADAVAPAATPLPAEATRGDPAVFRVQRALADRGYAEVGELDGVLGGPGSKTRAAIRAAQAENALEVTGEMDAAFLAALPAMPIRAVPAARAEATVRDLRAAGSTPVAAADGLGLIGRIVLGGGALGGLDASGALSKVKETADQATATVQSVQGVVNAGIGGVQWVAEHWWLVAVPVGAWAALSATRRLLEIRALYRQGTLTRAGA